MATPDTLWRTFHRRLQATDLIDGKVLGDSADFVVVDEKQRFFSPWLQLHCRAVGNRTEVRGRFTPKPEVWTFFMAVYAFLTLVLMGGLIYGAVQLSLGEWPWGFLIAPAALAAIGFVYGATLIGQGLSAEQMHHLRSFVESVVSEAESQSP